jgi:hypothetical protein
MATCAKRLEARAQAKRFEVAKKWADEHCPRTLTAIDFSIAVTNPGGSYNTIGMPVDFLYLIAMNEAGAKIPDDHLAPPAC